MSAEGLPSVVTSMDPSHLVLEVDETGTITNVTGEIEVLTGLSEEECIGEPWIDLFEEQAEVQALREETISLQEPCAEILPLKDSDGNSRWANVTIVPREAGASIAIQDVSDIVGHITRLERHHAHLEALHAATESLLQTTEFDGAATQAVEGITSALDQELVGIWLYDSDNDVLSPVAASTTSDAVIPDPPTFESDNAIAWQAFEEHRTITIDEMDDVADRLNPETPIGSEVITPLGEYGVMIVASERSHAFPQSDVAVVELWASTVTMVLLRIHREQLLKERRTEAIRERDRLEEFASLMSHDLRNPLTVANGYLELAQSEVESPHLDRVDGALDRMETLITDMLTLAREGWQAGEPEPVELESAIERAWGVADTKSATLNVDISGTIQADPGQLGQVLENIFSNAAVHGAEDTLVTVTALEDGFAIEDDGPGLDQEDQERIFEAGYSTSDDGTGFGLAIVQAIAEAHGWSVDVEEGELGGARFVFRGVEYLS